jgi:hypothetical protein
MAKTIYGPTSCIGPSCDWLGRGKGAQCVDGSGGCPPSVFLTAEESSIHDKTLADATKKLNRILSRIPEDPKGRKLSFMETRHGVLLGWVKHGGKPVAGGGVTRRDDDAKVAKFLKLKPSKK